MKNKVESEKILDSIKKGYVLEITAGSYYYSSEEYSSCHTFNSFRLILVKNISKTCPPPGTNIWARYTIEAKDLKTGTEFKFSCARPDFLVKTYEDGENWEVLFG